MFFLIFLFFSLNFSYISSLYKKEQKKFQIDDKYSFAHLIFPYKKIPFGDLILKYSIKNSLDPHLLTCLIYAESSFDKGAVSKDGAVGLMQFLVQNEEHWDKHKDPAHSLEVGASHLKNLLCEFNGEIYLAIASYNCGINCIKSKNKLPKETLFFTEKVLNCYAEVWSRTPNISFPFNFCEK